MSLVLDLIVISIIIVTIILSAKRGFIRTVTELVGFIAAIVISFTISTPLATVTYDKIIEPSVISSVTNSEKESTDDTVTLSWESLPKFIRQNSEKSGLTKENFQEKVTQNISNGVESAVKSVSQTAIKPVITRIISMIYSVILLVVLLFVVKIAAKGLNKLFSFSVIGTANHFLGGVVGLFKGTILAIVFCLGISSIVSFTTNGFLIFTTTAIENSFLFKFICQMTPFKIL